MNKQERMYVQIAGHGLSIIKFFNLSAQDPVALSRKLFRLENEARRYTTDYCNGEIETDQWEDIVDKLLMKLEKIIGKKNINKVFVNDDARGYALKIDDKYQDRLHRTSVRRDFGGYGIIAPDFRE